MLALESNATNLVNDDTNGLQDIFVRDRCPDGSCGGGITHSISGRVIDINNGNPIPGVTVSADTKGSAVTDSSGNYMINGLAAGTYRLTPYKIGYVFLPGNRTISVPPDATQHFIAGRATVTTGEDHTCVLITSGGVKCWGTTAMAIGRSYHYFDTRRRMW
jgi:hypothetical protein